MVGRSYPAELKEGPYWSSARRSRAGIDVRSHIRAAILESGRESARRVSRSPGRPHPIAIARRIARAAFPVSNLAVLWTVQRNAVSAAAAVATKKMGIAGRT